MNFGKIAIIGIGLIGSSVARAIKENNLSERLIAVDKDENNLKFVKNNKIVDEIYTTINKNVENVDIFILATPISFFKDIVENIVKFAKSGAIITDVGSVKSIVTTDIESVINRNDIFFVGSHPIAGSEKTGPNFGSYNLFKNKKCIITTSNKTDSNSIKKIDMFWKEIGLETEIMTTQKHDEIMSIVSHIPHLLAFVMVELSKKDNAIDYAGTGFNDFTRIAAANPIMWRDIFYSNQNFIIKHIQDFIDILKTIDINDKSKTLDFIDKIVTFKKSKY
jgi:prephenate dehydrogenase